MKTVLKGALDAEMAEHLDYEKHYPAAKNTGNSLNYYSKKNVSVDIELDIPRDREDEFQPRLVKKGKTRIDGFDEKTISLYTRWMTTRNIQELLKEMYGIEISPTFIQTLLILSRKINRLLIKRCRWHWC